MPHKIKPASEISKLKREVADLKSLISDQFSSQILINAQMATDLETMKLRVSQLSGLNRRVKCLIGKYREQKGQVDLLVELLRGKWKDSKCECGRERRVLSEENESEEKEEMESANNEALQQRSRKRKPKKPRNRKEPQSASTNDEVVFDENVSETATNTQLYTYTEVDYSRIGQSIPKYSEFYGPLECLNDAGQWVMKFVEHQTDRWHQIVKKGDSKLESKFVVLPQELSGMTVSIDLSGIAPPNSEEEFKIRLASLPRIKDNENILLPVELSIQVQIRLLNGDYRFSAQHKFKINKMSGYAEPDNFRLSYRNTDRDRIPQMIVTFYKS